MHTFTKLKHAFEPLIIFLKVFLNAGQGQVCCEHLRLCTQIFLHGVENWLFSSYVVPRSAAETFQLFCLDAAVRWVIEREGENQYINRTRVGKKEGGAH